MDEMKNRDISQQSGESFRQSGFDMPAPAGTERRRYFRIDDELVLIVRRLDQEHFDDELARFEERRNSVCFMNNIALEQENLSSLKRLLESKHPDIMEYVSFLEKRINILSEKVMQRSNEPPEPVQKVNISEQGIRFYAEETYNKDDLVELRICLQPNKKRLLIIGNVVWCLKDPNTIGKNSNVVAVDFTYIDEADRGVLVEHILRNRTRHSNIDIE
jgi:hypothetical protein